MSGRSRDRGGQNRVSRGQVSQSQVSQNRGGQAQGSGRRGRRLDGARDDYRPPQAPDPSVASTPHANDAPARHYDPVYPLEVNLARPTLAPVLLAFGIFLMSLGGLVTQWWLMAFGALAALYAAWQWVRESLISTDAQHGEGET